MKKLQACVRRITRKEYLPIWIFAGIQLVYHIMMREPEGSDAMWFFRNQLDAYTAKDYLATRYDTWTSRLLIEWVLIYISRHMLLWRILDWAFWVFLAWAFVGLFPKEKRETATYIVVGFLLIYPLWNLRTAGWIATSTNYTWTLALGVFSLHGVARAFYGQKTSIIQWILYGLAALYGANMEQVSAVLLAMNFCAIVYFAMEKKPLRLYGTAIVGFVIAAAEFIFIMTCPGNGARKSQEIVNWMPNFASYHLLDKVSMGFADTMHHMLTSGNFLFLCYGGLLMLLVFAKTREIKYRIAALVPVAVNVLLAGFWSTIEQQFPTFAKAMEKNAFITGSNYHIGTNYIPLVVYLLVIGSLVYALIAVCDTYLELFGQWILLGVGLATRVIMGFTPTIYVSQERTFLYMYMLMGMSAVCLVNSNWEVLQKKEKVQDVMKLAGACFVIAGVILNMAEIGAV